MGTRLYPAVNTTSSVGQYLSPVTPSSWSAGWNKTTGTTATFLLVPAGRVQEATQSPTNAASGTSGHFTAVSRVVSPPLLADHTFSGTVKGQFKCREPNATDEFTLAFALKVIQPDGSDRGVLVAVSASDDISTSPPEMPITTITNRKLLDSSESAAITLSSVSASRGDMIVLEIGFRQASTSVAAGLITFQAGVATDLAEDNTDTGNDNSWIEFSQTLPEFGPNFWGFAATPADGASATNTADPTAVTFPTALGAMTTADLVVMMGHRRATGATPTISADGGQSWTSETTTGTSLVSFRPFWCQFDGTWDTDPSVAFGATTCNSVVGLVFRGPVGYTWSVNQAIATSADASDPFTITGQTTTGNNGTVTLAGWAAADDNTWGTLAGTNWANPGGAYAGTQQFRNTSGSDQSSTYAYKVQAIAGATGNVEKSQLTLGADAAATFIITFAATAPAGSSAMEPTAGSLTLSSSAPAVVQGTVVTATAGALTLSGAAPGIIQGTVITPTVGSLTLSGEAPTVSKTDLITVTPTAGTLTLSGAAPTVVSNTFITPTAGTLSLSSAAPSVVTGTIITPTAGALTLSAAAPDVVLGTVITPTVGSLTLSSSAPTVTQGGVSDTSVTPTEGTLTLSGTAPTVIRGTIVTPTVGTLTLTGVAPSVVVGTVITPTAGAVTLSAAAPTVLRGTIITPTVGTVTISSSAPDVVQGTVITPDVGSLGISGFTPTITFGGVTNFTITPDTASLLLSSDAPTVTVVTIDADVVKTGTGGIDPRIVKPVPFMGRGRTRVEERIDDTREIHAEVAGQLARELGDESDAEIPINELSMFEVDQEIGRLLRKVQRTQDDEIMLLLLMTAV